MLPHASVIVGHGHDVERLVVLVVGGVAGHVRHRLDAFELAQFACEGGALLVIKPAHHHAQRMGGDGVGNLCLHELHARLHRRAVGQVLGHVGVDVHAQHEQAHDRREHGHEDQHGLPTLDDEPGELVLHCRSPSF